MNPMLWSLPSLAPFRLFFAVRPPRHLSDAIWSLGCRLKGAHRLRGNVIGPDRLHNTLALAYHEAEAWHDHDRHAIEAAMQVRAARFPVLFDWTASFAHPDARYPLVMRGGEGVAALLDFQQELATCMRRAGFHVRAGFTPHITLLWGDRQVDEHPMRPIGWTVEEFVLVRSWVGLSQHDILGRWRLH